MPVGREARLKHIRDLITSSDPASPWAVGLLRAGSGVHPIGLYEGDWNLSQILAFPSVDHWGFGLFVWVLKENMLFIFVYLYTYINSMCTIGINTNQSQFWIFNSQSTASYHLYLCLGRWSWWNHFTHCAIFFFSPPVYQKYTLEECHKRQAVKEYTTYINKVHEAPLHFPTDRTRFFSKQLSCVKNTGSPKKITAKLLTMQSTYLWAV